MRKLKNGMDPTKVGTVCEVEGNPRRTLVDFIQTVQSTQELMEIGCAECGWLTRIGATERERFGLNDKVEGVVYWWNGDSEYPEDSLMELTDPEVRTLSDESENVLVSRIFRYYEVLDGTDDGHPAYKLYALLRDREPSTE